MSIQPSPVLACPGCGVPLRLDGQQACETCGAQYELVGGDIVSFLPAGAGTMLDAIDYDAYYKVDGQASDHLYRQCRRYLGDLLPPSRDSYLEIGAGTGLFTLAYLSEARPRQAMITDVSAKMLAACRQRLQTRCVDTHTDVAYALWDGTTRCFLDRAFDLVCGFSVLHHVLDYEGMLGILRDALTEDGRAVFLEPSLAFHRAMFDFLLGVLQAMPVGDPAWTGEDYEELADWICQNCINMKFAGDQFVLESREDKHMFDGESLRAAAARAGFGACRVIPFGDENEAWTTIWVYLHQLPFSPQARALLLDYCARRMPGPFVYLAEEDRAPSFLVVLERNASGSPMAAERGTSPVDRINDPDNQPVKTSGPAVVFKHPNPRFRYALAFALKPGPLPGQLEVSAEGWLFGDVDVRQIELEAGVRFPVGALRLDVQARMNADFAYPLQRVLYSGILQLRPQFLDAAVDAGVPVTLVTMCGDRYELGRLDRKRADLHLDNLAGHELRRVTIVA
jgi:ubiquinone/menaquinone biosynthesis C-methylase UbiE